MPEATRLRLQAVPQLASCCIVFIETAYSESFNQANYNILFLSGLLTLTSLLALTFSIYTLTSLSLSERGREVSLLRVVGFTSGRLRIFLLARALLLTLAAYGLGWLAALVFINYQHLHTSFDLLFMVLRLSPASSLIGLALALLFAFLGVWLTTGRQFAHSQLLENE